MAGTAVDTEVVTLLTVECVAELIKAMQDMEGISSIEGIITVDMEVLTVNNMPNKLLTVNNMLNKLLIRQIHINRFKLCLNKQISDLMLLESHPLKLQHNLK